MFYVLVATGGVLLRTDDISKIDIKFTAGRRKKIGPEMKRSR